MPSFKATINMNGSTIQIDWSTSVQLTSGRAEVSLTVSSPHERPPGEASSIQIDWSESATSTPGRVEVSITVNSPHGRPPGEASSTVEVPNGATRIREERRVVSLMEVQPDDDSSSDEESSEGEGYDTAPDGGDEDDDDDHHVGEDEPRVLQRYEEVQPDDDSSSDEESSEGEDLDDSDPESGDEDDQEEAPQAEEEAIPDETAEAAAPEDEAEAPPAEPELQNPFVILEEMVRWRRPVLTTHQGRHRPVLGRRSVPTPTPFTPARIERTPYVPAKTPPRRRLVEPEGGPAPKRAKPAAHSPLLCDAGGQLNRTDDVEEVRFPEPPQSPRQWDAPLLPPPASASEPAPPAPPSPAPASAPATPPQPFPWGCGPPVPIGPQRRQRGLWRLLRAARTNLAGIALEVVRRLGYGMDRPEFLHHLEAIQTGLVYRLPTDGMDAHYARITRLIRAVTRLRDSVNGDDTAPIDVQQVVDLMDATHNLKRHIKRRSHIKSLHKGHIKGHRRG